MPEKCSLCKSSETNDVMKLDFSSDTDSGSETDSRKNPDNVTFYRWQIFEKKINKSKADVTFKDAVKMFKDDIKTLREHIRIKREQINASHEIKSSFSENNLMLHVDFTESYKNDQQYVLQSAYFKNQSFSIFTACCYIKRANNNNVRSFSVIAVTESSDHNRFMSLIDCKKLSTRSSACMKKRKRMFSFEVMELGHNLLVKLLASAVLPGKTLSWYYNERHHGKDPMDGIGGTVRNAIFRKVNSGQLVVYFPLEFSEAVTKFVPLIPSAYLPENENIVEPEDISNARKINQTLKIRKLERKCSQNDDTYINFFKIADDEDSFHVWVQEWNHLRPC